MQEPEFAPGDEVMLVSPAGAPPYPSGPAIVVGCISFDTRTQITEYVIEFEDGRREKVDGVEVWALEEWAEWMKVHAN